MKKKSKDEEKPIKGSPTEKMCKRNNIHLPPLKHRLISTCVKSYSRQPIRVHQTYDIRFCFGVQIQTQEKHLLLSYAADRPSKTLIPQRL